MIEQIGLDEAKAKFLDFPVNIRSAMVKSINNVAPVAHTLGVDRINGKVALPKTYIKNRLYISQRATNTDPMAVISGRVRPTQLQRYSGTQLFSPAKLPGKKRLDGVSVRVKQGGGTKRIAHGWVMKLKAGSSDDSIGSNLGIATRTGKGKKDFRIRYGASVDQVFRAVKDEIRPEVEQLLADEWRKQMRDGL